jgi:hypothetical protein
MFANSWVAAQLAASQEGLSSMKLVTRDIQTLIMDATFQTYLGLTQQEVSM